MTHCRLSCGRKALPGQRYCRECCRALKIPVNVEQSLRALGRIYADQPRRSGVRRLFSRVVS